MQIIEKNGNLDQGTVFLLTRLYTEAVRDGAINPIASEDVLEQNFDSFYESLASAEFQVVIDYKNNLLTHARSFLVKNEYELSILLYATWFEHWFNQLIAVGSARAGLEESELTKILKDVPFRAKIDWLPKIFGLKPIHTFHRDTIMRIVDLRNAFVHYKWKPRNSVYQQELEGTTKRVEKSITYLKNYWRRHLLKNRIPVIRKLARKKAASLVKTHGAG